MIRFFLPIRYKRAGGVELDIHGRTNYFQPFVSMIIDTRTIVPGHSQRSETLYPGVERADWPAFDGGLECQCAIDKIHHEICIKISLKGKLKLQCARCLNSFPYEVSAETAIILVPRSVQQRGRDSADDATVFEYDERTPEVDIGPALYDEIITSIPMKPLCTEDCRGVETRDSVAAESSCRQPDDMTADSRWDALKKLKRENHRT